MVTELDGLSYGRRKYVCKLVEIEHVPKHFLQNCLTVDQVHIHSKWRYNIFPCSNVNQMYHLLKVMWYIYLCRVSGRTTYKEGTQAAEDAHLCHHRSNLRHGVSG